ncbi:hypothetical protein CRENBAI_008983 [Crenichthys baileyi]|uniref:Uncharacterized protein n=1 Tax=Crenichthys baileyi TaxID=28760 RepID=A0AAV9R3E5_9TELE
MADAIERVAWLYLLNKARERRRLAPLRRVWIHQTIQRRSEFGEFHHLLQELRAEEDRFQRHFAADGQKKKMNNNNNDGGCLNACLSQVPTGSSPSPVLEPLYCSCMWAAAPV